MWFDVVWIMVRNCKMRNCKSIQNAANLARNTWEIYYTNSCFSVTGSSIANIYKPSTMSSPTSKRHKNRNFLHPWLLSQVEIWAWWKRRSFVPISKVWCQCWLAPCNAFQWEFNTFGWLKDRFFLSDFRIPLPYLQYSMEDNRSWVRVYGIRSIRNRLVGTEEPIGARHVFF